MKISTYMIAFTLGLTLKTHRIAQVPDDKCVKGPLTEALNSKGYLHKARNNSALCEYTEAFECTLETLSDMLSSTVHMSKKKSPSRIPYAPAPISATTVLNDTRLYDRKLNQLNRT